MQHRLICVAAILVVIACTAGCGEDDPEFRGIQRRRRRRWAAVRTFPSPTTLTSSQALKVVIRTTLARREGCPSESKPPAERRRLATIHIPRICE
jgi:hypothetical protein